MGCAEEKELAMRTNVRPKIIVGLVLLLVAVLAACGGPTPAVPALSLALSSSSGTVFRGQSMTVDVTLTRSGGASEDVQLSADIPTYPDVKATFTPLTLTGSILTSTMTIDVGTDADDGPVTIMVSADGPDLSASEPFTLTVDSLTVTGSVVALFGAPLSGASVSSQGVAAVTAADGSFTLAGLSVPYDVTVYSTADQWVHVFEGMTTSDPVLMPAGAALGSSPSFKSAALSGTLTGATVPVAAGHVMVVCAEGLSGPTYASCDRLTPGDSTYSLTVSWNGAASEPIRVHALEYAVDGGGIPTAYGGYGMAETTVTDGGTLTKDVALGAGPSSTTFTGAVSTAPGLTLSTAYASLRLSDNLSIAIAPFDPTLPFSLPMPNLTNATFDAMVTATSASTGQSAGWKVRSTGSAGMVELGAPPVLITPPPGSTDVTLATQFKAANEAGGVLTFIWMSSGSAPAFAVTTAGDTATIPDVAGIALPPATAYNLLMIGSTGYTTVDAATQAYLQDFYNVMLLSTNGGPGPSTDGGMVLGGVSTGFTTAP